MEMNFTEIRFRDFNAGYNNPTALRAPVERILLRGPELCKECGNIYESLYSIKICRDHIGLEGI